MAIFNYYILKKSLLLRKIICFIIYVLFILRKGIYDCSYVCLSFGFMLFRVLKLFIIKEIINLKIVEG